MKTLKLLDYHLLCTGIPTEMKTHRMCIISGYDFLFVLKKKCKDLGYNNDMPTKFFSLFEACQTRLNREDDSFFLLPYKDTQPRLSDKEIFNSISTFKLTPIECVHFQEIGISEESAIWYYDRTLVGSDFSVSSKISVLWHSHLAIRTMSNKNIKDTELIKKFAQENPEKFIHYQFSDH